MGPQARTPLSHGRGRRRHGAIRPARPAVVPARARRTGRPPADDGFAANHSATSVCRLFRVRRFPLLANSGATDAQTFTVTSSNPDIAASVAQGPFWTLGVSYSNATTPAENFTGSLTFQLFQNLTPNTVSMIEQFTNDGYYVNTGKYFPRIVSDFDSPLTTVIQGGASNNEGTGASGQPNTPVWQRKRAGAGTHRARINWRWPIRAGRTRMIRSFSSTPARPTALGYNYTVFGQLVAGQNTLDRDGDPGSVQKNPATGEDSQPVNPLTITSASLSSTSPDGVVILDTTEAKPGETATITVTATDPTDGTTASQSFNVVVGDYVGPTTSPTIGNINFRRTRTRYRSRRIKSRRSTVQLSGQNTYPDATVKVPLTYSLASDPTHGTITNFERDRPERSLTRLTPGTWAPTRSSMR